MLTFHVFQSAKQREKKVFPLQVTQMARVKTEPGLTHSIDCSRVPAAGHSISGVPSHQHLDNKFGIAGVATENGQVVGKGRPVQGVSALGTNLPGECIRCRRMTLLFRIFIGHCVDVHTSLLVCLCL